MSGKTSLVMELVRAGAEYFSDEYAVLDDDGRVHPYAKRISIRGREGAQTRLFIEELGGLSGTTPVPVGLVVVTSYETGADWRPSRLSQGRAMLAMLDNTVVIRSSPERALRIVRIALGGATLAIASKRGEGEDVSAELLGMLTSDPRPLQRRDRGSG